MDVACRRGQGLGSVLEAREPFDLLLIMAGANDLVLGVAPGMVLHSIQALHAKCQMGCLPKSHSNEEATELGH